MQIRKGLIGAALVLGLGSAPVVLAPAPAEAIGCLSGGAAGAVAGHYAGHHAVLGAIGGCIAGHHMKVMQRRRAMAAAAHPTPMATPAPAATPSSGMAPAPAATPAQ